MKLNSLEIINAILDHKTIRRKAWEKDKVINTTTGMEEINLEDALACDWEIVNE